MKALKMVLVTIFVVFSVMTYSSESNSLSVSKVPVMLAHTTAKHLPEVVYSINTQVNPEVLLASSEKVMLTANVKVDTHSYIIYGTYKEWYEFFYSNEKNIPFEQADKSERKTE